MPRSVIENGSGTDVVVPPVVSPPPVVVIVPGTDTTPLFKFPPIISAAKMLPLAFAMMRSLTNASATWNKISLVN